MRKVVQIMAVKASGEGSIYFNKQRKNWNAHYKEYDVNSEKMKYKTKSFKTEESKKYLSTIMYQKENPLYIEHNGIPLCEILKQNLRLKLDINQMSPTQYSRVLKTINALEKTSIGNKNIDTITSDEIQTYLNSLKYLSNSMIEKSTSTIKTSF